VAATVFCAPTTVDLSIINGDVVIEDGRLKTLDAAAVVARQNTLAQELVRSVGSNPF
jgi:hypothetical protein